MKMTREDIEKKLTRWNRAWDEHDLEGVMALFHEEVLFENWTGARVEGKQALRQAWAPWFEKHGGFRFIEEDTFIDADQQKVLYRWQLNWPSMEKEHRGKPEKRRGIDVMHFKDGKIIQKLTYSKTVLDIDGQQLRLKV